MFILSLGATAFADSALIPVSDTNVLNGLSPLNWVIKSNFVDSAVGGASIKVGFTGTSRVALEIDTKIIRTTVAARFPVLSWSVNGGSNQTHQIVKGETSVLLASEVSDPVIDLYLKGFNPFDDRYRGDAPANSVKITGFDIDKGGVTKPLSFPPKLWMNIGSSLESGDAALYYVGQGRPPNNDWSASDDARASYPYLLATHFGYREIRLAYGGYNWQGNGGIPNLSTLIDNITSTVSRLTDGLLIPRPDIVTVYLAGNGVPTTNSVINGLAKIRLRTGPATRVIVMISPNGTNRGLITDAFNTYKDNSQDTNLFLVDVGNFPYVSADGSHATAAGHQTIYNQVLPAFEKLIP